MFLNRLLLTIFALLSFAVGGKAQQKICVSFKDKQGVRFDPYNYFDAKAIERRIKHGIPLSEYTDFPVKSQYVEAVASNSQQVKVVSRWLNAVVCMADEQQIEIIKQLPFVADVEIMEKPVKMITGLTTGVNDLSESDRLLLESQTQRMGAASFTEAGITGKGVRVAIFDIGFESYKTNPAFDHIRSANRIIKTWDFVKKSENVDGFNTHGTFVLSCIAGKTEGIQMGLAQDADFLLARTETWTEFFSEEEFWLAASEWADKNGADIINSSLGYTFHRYFPEDMNGKKSLVSKAATIAARKGILVVNSAGNEGDGDWKIIGTPADADSVLSIGGISPWTGYHTSFSSFGPTRDKRMKPNVTAYGHVIGSGPGGLSQTQGTSFSGPLVAGFSACAMQARPNLTNMQLFKEIERSADLFPYFDYAHGYGVPQATYFTKENEPGITEESKIEFEDKDGKVTIKILDVVAVDLPFEEDAEIEDAMIVDEEAIPVAMDTSEAIEEIVEDTVIEEIVEAAVDTASWEDSDTAALELPYEYEEEQESLFTAWPDYVFFHIENSQGYLDKYWVVDPQPNFAYIFKGLNNSEEPAEADENSPFVISKADYARPFTLRVYYKGEVKSYIVK
jgi:hypothetical protein